MIRDGHAVRVATEVAQHLQRSAEGGLGIDDPVLTAQTSQKLSELRAVPEHGCEPSVAELLATVKALRRRFRGNVIGASQLICLSQAPLPLPPPGFVSGPVKNPNRLR